MIKTIPRLYRQANIRDEKAIEKELYGHLNAIEAKINVLVLPEAKSVEQALYDTYKNETSEITYMPLLGIGYSLIEKRGQKEYELTNHLGNVLATVSDKKLGHSSNDSTVDYYNADVVSAQDYYPFGMLQPGRSYLSPTEGSRYRYGFNGKESDNEVKGEGNQQDYGMRVYDPRLGKFLSMDPLTKDYPWYTPYQFAGNTPIQAIDLDGLEEWKVNNGGTVTGPYANQGAAQEAANRDPSIIKYNYKNLPEHVVTPISINTLLKKYPRKLSLAVSGAYSTALSMYSGRYNTYASVGSEVMEHLSEEQKQKDFLTNASKTNGILIWEFLTGTGKQFRQFDERHPVTDEIKYSLSTERAIAAFVHDYQAGKFADGETRYYYASSSPDKTDKLASLKAHARGYMSNISVFLRGGMEYYLTKHGNNVSVRVIDAYTVASMITRNDADNIQRHKIK